jgi:class 3 adenylate cyclase
LPETRSLQWAGRVERLRKNADNQEMKGPAEPVQEQLKDKPASMMRSNNTALAPSPAVVPPSGFIHEYDTEGSFDYSSSSYEGSSSGESESDSDSESDSSSYEDDLSTDSSISSCLSNSYDGNRDDEERHPDGVPKKLEFTGEDIALVTEFMGSNEVNHVMSALVERGGIMTSINWVSAHVPTCVLDYLGDEVRTGTAFREVSGDSMVSECDSVDDEESLVSELSEREFSSTVGGDSDTLDTDAHKALHLEDVSSMARHSLSSNGEQNGTYSRENNSSMENHRSRQPGSFCANGMNMQRKAAVGVDVNLESRQWAAGETATTQQNELNRGRSPPRPIIRKLSVMTEKLTVMTEKSTNSSQRSFSSGGPEMAGSNQHAQRLIHNSKPMTIGEGNVLGEEIPHYAQDLTPKHRLALQAFGIGVPRNPNQSGPIGSARKVLAYKDPFPYDSDEGQPDRSNKSLAVSRPSLLISASTRRRNRRRIEAAQYLTLPHSSSHQAALLFVDISGFTKLATSLDPEHLSKAINSYFQMIVNEVTSQGGDVLKFAGDGVFVEWKAASNDPSPSLIDRKKLSLTQCVCAAAVCAAKIVAKCSDFSIFAHHALGSTAKGQGAQVATLNVHCGIGVGEIVGVHVGDYESRREFVILGDPIDQVCAAVNAASLGEAAVSPQALMTLAKSCKIDEALSSAPAGKPVVIARRAICRFAPRLAVLSAIDQMSPPRALSQIIDSWHLNSLNQYKELISLYVHPVVVANDSSNQNHPRSKSTVQERHREEAELRSVFVLFVTPLISVRVTGNKEADTRLYKLLNNIMNLTTRELARFSGHLRQFIVDDKGVVLIATFGLRGSTFPNMVAERALPATIALHNVLRSELGVQNQVGATIGNTYCGVVGGIRRHEYAVMGPSVNLAARLMSSPKNPGILVDNAVRTMADRSYAFNALPPVKAKGYSEPVPIFEPLSPRERSWGRVQPNFVGRKAEIMSMMVSAREMALTQCPSKIVYITGESGMGKSTMVVHAIEHVRKLMGASRRRVIVTKYVSKESDRLVPFGIFRSILVNVLSYFKASQDDKSYASYASSNGMVSISWESLSGASFSDSEGTGLTRSADRLSSICRELNAPAAFEELVGHHLLGVENKSREAYKNRGKGSNMKSLVSFMAKAFKRCTQEASLVMVALDDVQHVDEMSWRVVQELFETAGNVLFLCTSRPLSTYRLLVDNTFWEELTTGRYHEEERFQMMTLDRLAESDIKAMIAKTLGLQEREVSSTLLNDVMMQSNGLPHFANEILETMKRKKGTLLEESKGDVAYGSVGELLLHRIDSFHASVRNVLNLGAVLGSSFEMREVVAVLRQIIGKKESDRKSILRTAKDALDVAVSEGILYAVHEGADFIDDGMEDSLEESAGYHESLNSISSLSLVPIPLTESSIGPQLVYTFCHDVWRTTILNLMLDSRKRDMHKIIAKTLEQQKGRNQDDYLSRMKLFSHWKASGESKNAASLALSIGSSFEELGLQDQSIKVFQDALDMWKVADESGGKLLLWNSEGIMRCAHLLTKFQNRFSERSAECIICR